uniref:Zinc finger, CCHC-type n=1 Tax=Tanacetum cinerariifolium TaxID=118510 RepID=A0A6L2P2I4_TANCI|nr:hypothetical protein [Tanacetum cinerariifolium]
MSILLANKLNGSNFTNWYRNLRIVLRNEKNMKFAEQSTRPAHDPKTADPDTIDKYYDTVNLEQEVACLMLSSMSPGLQRTLEKYNAYDMVKELKNMYEEQAKQELLETVKAFHACKQEEGQSISSYLLKMKSYLDILERLGYAMPNELGHEKTTAELHAMVKLHEKSIPNKAETPAVLAIREGKSIRTRRNQKGQRGLRGSKKLKHEALSMYMGNGMHAVVEAIRSFDLVLPSALIIVLDNFSKDNVFYFRAILRGGIYKIFIQMILQPTHDESLEKCKSCIFGKMARKPFPHQVKRAKNLLGLIHTDVFQNEVENQLSKKMKAIRSDQGDEYLSYDCPNNEEIEGDDDEKSFVELSNVTYDLSLGVVKFANGIEEIAYKMPRKIEQYDSLSDMEKENTKSVYFRNEKDKRKGVEYVMSKILGFYKECLELGPEYRIRPEESSSGSDVDDQGGVT